MNPEPAAKPVVRNFNKPAYIIFVLAGTCYLFAKDFSQAAIFWGLALVFDPFNPQMPFGKRPFYQQAWLFIHLSVTLALSVLMLTGK